MKTKPNSKYYSKVVEWSDEDNCFIGSAPPLVGRCCHGRTEASVIEQLGVIVEEILAIHKADKTAPPAPTSGKQYSGKFLLRVRPEVHQALILQAAQGRQSLNSLAARLIEQGLSTSDA